MATRTLASAIADGSEAGTEFDIWTPPGTVAPEPQGAPLSDVPHGTSEESGEGENVEEGPPGGAGAPDSGDAAGGE